MTTALDLALNAADGALRTLFAKPRASRTCPTVPAQATELSLEDKALSGALMRVNHVGEVCAQALYAAQALGTRDAVLRKHFLKASQEEGDHLAWTKDRLDELGARPSLLNPLVVRGRLWAGPGGQPAGRPAEPGLCGGNRTPGGSAPGQPPGTPARRRPRVARHRGADEGR